MKPRSSTALVPRRMGLEPRRGSPLALVADGRLVPAESPDRRTADGYLRLTAHILLEAERHGFRTLGVLSALSGEGKTTAAVNLAACLGRARGRKGRVLLVDGDARGRTLTRLLCGPGASARTEPMVTATSFEGVDLLTAPGGDESPAIRAPGSWIDTLRTVAARYPQVVIDCPAVLADPEALVLRECVEALVLVVEVGRTTRQVIEKAVGDVGRRVVGVILNGADEADVVGGNDR